MSDWRYLVRRAARDPAGGRHLHRDVRHLLPANHPAGFTANVVQTAANKGVLLALVAMAQTFVVITAGIDLSVGMIFILDQLPRLVDRRRLGGERRARRRRRAAGRARCAARSTGSSSSIGRLQPIVTTIATGAVYFGIALLAAARFPAATFNADLADALTGKLFGVVPASLVALAGVVLVVWVPYQPLGDRPRGLRRRLVRDRRLHVGRAGPPRQVRRLYAVGPARRASAGCFSPSSPIRAKPPRQRQHLHAVLDRRRGAGRRVAVRRHGQRDRRDLRRAGVPHHRRSAVRLRSRSALAAAVPGRGAARSRSASARRGCSRSATGWSCSHERRDARRPRRLPDALMRRIDPPVAIAFGCIVAAAASRQPLFDATSCRRNICCSN